MHDPELAMYDPRATGYELVLKAVHGVVLRRHRPRAEST